MTVDKTILLERLQNLRKLSSNNKFKLVKAEQEEALAVLSDLATADCEGSRAAVDSLPEFPSDVGAELLANYWAGLTEAGILVLADLREQKFRSDSGKRMRLALAQRLLRSDPYDALRILVDVCQEMKPERKAIPTSKHLGLIRTAFAEPGAKSVGLLPLEKAMASEVNLLAAYLLAAVFVLRKKSQKPIPPQTQLAIIRWVNGYPNLKELSSDVTNSIIETVKGWDDDFRSLLAAEINTLQISLRNVLQPLCQSSPTPDVPRESQDPPPSLPSEPTVRPVQDPEYDVLYEMGRLSRHLRQLEDELKQGQRSLRDAERDRQQARNELAVVRREQQETLRAAAVSNDSATRLADEKSVLVEQLETMQIALHEAQAELEAAGDHHKRTVASHGEHLDNLSERIAREGKHCVDAFRNNLAAKVQVYADELREARDMEMTVDIGTALRNQMKQLLRFLKSEGVRIDGRL